MSNDSVMADPVVRSSVLGTGAFTVIALSAAASPNGLTAIAVVVDLLLFALGCLAFVGALVRAAARSRTEELSVGGLWFLTGGTPRPVRLALLGALGVQVAVALGTAAARPFTGLAFGILVPVYGLGLCGLWAAQRATFPPRRPPGQVRPGGST